MTFQGYIRIFAHKLNLVDHEVLSVEAFDAGLVSSCGRTRRPWLTGEVSDDGATLWEDDVRNVLRRYELGDVVEIYAEAYLDSYVISNPEVGEDVNVVGELREVKHRKLTDEEVEDWVPDEQSPEEASREP